MEEKQALDEIYGDRFFRKRNSLNWRARPICQAIRKEFHPASVIDVGCAIGDLVHEFCMMGIDAYGLEGSRACLPYLVCEAGRLFMLDLREPLPEGMNRYDLVTCFEVAEHIEHHYAAIFVRNLAQLSDRVLMSAAPPGQGGHHHVNCQPEGYWIDQFWHIEYAWKPQFCDSIKSNLEPWKNKPGVKAIYQNMLYFEKWK